MTILRVDVKPELLRWARERAGIEPDALERRFPKYREWESGYRQPTLKQLESLAKVTHAPIGSFFLSQPLEERIPIPDLRTVGDRPIRRPSVDLLDTVYLCQQRQDWYRDFARMEGEDPLSFVGSATHRSTVESTAEEMRTALGFDLDERRTVPTWTEALRRFIEQADSLGVLVMTSGIVGNNTHRKLDPGRVPRLCLGRRSGPTGLHQWRRQQGRADVHTRARIGPHLAGRVCPFGRRAVLGAVPRRRGLVQPCRRGASRPAGFAPRGISRCF